MAALTCILDRKVPVRAIVSTMAIGLISTLAIWGTRHASHARARTRRTQRQANQMECRYMIASWMTNPDDPVWALFDAKDTARGTTTH